MLLRPAPRHALHRGLSIKDIPFGYLQWLRDDADLIDPELWESADAEIQAPRLLYQYELYKRRKAELRKTQSKRGIAKRVDE